jgi:hypothetical protein
MPVDHVDDEFAEADDALDLGDNAVAASLIDRHLGHRAFGSEAPAPSDAGAFAQKLSAAEDLVRHEPRERLLVLDPGGRVTLYLRGNGSRVLLPTDREGRTDRDALQQLERAYCLMHNHPVESCRPIGGTLSLSDIALGQRFRIRTLRVAAPEATYSLWSKNEVQWDASWVTRTERAYRYQQASLDRAMATVPGTFTRDIYFYLRVFDFLMVQLAKRLGLQYERIDRPREEWAMAIPTPPAAVPKPEVPTIIDDAEHFRWMTSVLDSPDL